jgi:YgiT-type zinc finger domain-containing protein
MRDIDKPPLTCHECQMGRMRHRLITYITWLGDDVITVPDFPAWVCDVCGLRIYDGNALNKLSLLLSPNAGRPTQRSTKLISQPSRKKPQPSRPE